MPWAVLHHGAYIQNEEHAAGFMTASKHGQSQHLEASAGISCAATPAGLKVETQSQARLHASVLQRCADDASKCMLTLNRPKHRLRRNIHLLEGKVICQEAGYL